MGIARWDPWGEVVSLRDAMDRLLAESVVRPRAGDGGTAGALALDVEERGDHFIVTAPIPGVKPEDVEIAVQGDTLRVHAERRDERQEGGEGQRWLLREQRFGAFDRVVTLPCPVKAGQAQAEFTDGVLTITLPKAEEAKERRIPVRAGTGHGSDVPIEAGAKGSKQTQDQSAAGPDAKQRS